MTRKIAFLDRDGVLIHEPEDTKQIDSLDKLKILPNVVGELKNLIKNGYELVMVSNQNGVGTDSFPQEDFDIPQNALLTKLKEEGVEFAEVFICPHMPEDNCNCRKPKTGLVDDFLKENDIDLSASFVIGDRDTDMELAENMGIKGYKMKTNGSFPRLGFLNRKTAETDINMMCNLDGKGTYNISTGLNFFDHMMEQISKHSLIDLAINCKGDLEVDEHHTIEDIGLALGEMITQALGDKKGIRRYGFLMPMDETLAEVAIDLGGRPNLVFNAEFRREKVGDLPTEMVKHFFKSLSDTLKATIHINVKYGENEHHIIEGIFKGMAKCLRQACEEDERAKDLLPSTKGII